MPFDIEELVTPCYVIHKNGLETTMLNFKQGAQYIWPNTIIAYSYKTNYHPFILKTFKNYGYYAEVVSEEEYRIAKEHVKCGDKIIYNGPVKSKESFLNAVKNGCIVNIDSSREIDWLSELPYNNQYTVGVRVNFDFSKYSNEMKKMTSRFGFSIENGEFINAIRRIEKLRNIRVNCLHMHRGGNSRSLEIYRCITEMACQIIMNYSLKIDYIDIGGGFKLGVNNDLTTESYMQTIKKIIYDKYNYKNMGLILEPGNSLVYSSIDYCTKVIDIQKINGEIYVTLDGSRIHTDPMFKRNEYLNITIKRHNSINIGDIQYTLCGCTCKESDRFTRINTGELQIDDMVIFEKIGAYSMSLAPNFILPFPSVYVENESDYLLCKDKCSYFSMNY